MDALGQPIPDDHIPQGLALVEGRAGDVNHAHQLQLVRGVFLRTFGMWVAQIIHRLADFLQILVHRLAVGVVGFIAENGELWQAGNRLQAQVGDFRFGFVFFFLYQIMWGDVSSCEWFPSGCGSSQCW